MAMLEVGDKVICIEGFPGYLKLGEIYTVEIIHPFDYVSLKEGIIHHKWDATRFCKLLHYLDDNWEIT